jgi:type I restriction enzyme R subunit
VRGRTHTGEILDPDRVYRLDEGVLDVLADAEKPDTVKVFNLLKVLDEQVRERGREAPYLVPIGERAEEVARQFHERQLDTQVALDELTKLLTEARAADERRQQSDFSTEGFSVYFLLNRVDVPDAEPIAREMEQVFAEHPHWRQSEAQEREVRLGLYKALLDRQVERVTDVVGYVLSVVRRA